MNSNMVEKIAVMLVRAIINFFVKKYDLNSHDDGIQHIMTKIKDGK